MKFPTRIFFPLFALSFAAACASPSTPAPDLNALNTAVAGTVVGAIALSAVPGAPLSIETSTLIFTPGPPTLTPTASLTATITLTPTPLFTPTPLVPRVSVSVPTNCRNGPGKIYGYKGALLVGQTAEVFARDPSGNYWYIRNPDVEGDFCWIWGNYATITGNFAILPVYTPPPTPSPTFTPTPSPSFSVSYSSMDSCAANWWADIKLKNTGAISFKSLTITIKDKVTDITLVDLSDGFVDVDGCLKTTTKDIVAPGDAYLLSAPAFSYNPAGHELRVVLTLCSDTGQKGMCATEKFDFTP